MLDDKPLTQTTKLYMQGIRAQISNSTPKIKQIKNLKSFLNEIDKRRNRNYSALFPWLDEEFKKYL